jgi:isocitrate/isopropylmalate dehydrogenase
MSKGTPLLEELTQIVTDPTPYNDRVMVMPNLYGDILSDLSAGYTLLLSS